MVVIDKDFVQKWSQVYDERFRGGKAAIEEKAIRDWLSNQKEPKYLNKEYFVRLGRWKSARVTKHYEANDDYEIIKATEAAYLSSDELFKLKLLQTLHGVGVAVAGTILHYLQPDVFPIFDIHCRKVLKEATLWSRDKNDDGKQAWLDYLQIMRKLSNRLGVSLRNLDKAMFAYDKRGIYLQTSPD